MLITLTDWRREPTGDREVERLAVDLTVKNPAASLGEARYLPAMEARDAAGAVYAALNVDDRLGEPLQAHEQVRVTQQFEVLVAAERLSVVFAPGSNDETIVDLEP